ncbi:hypothetical protein F5Y14DRAFT_409771 [Nemania sp. NC0429]|nr:hypothetical protein F5Y14DRAFT_409771 [Nemania sp. NC0429]
MKWTSFLCLLTWATSVTASVNAGGYERLYYWWVYQMEVHVYGGDATRMTMGIGCEGTGRFNTCNFNQFINYISSGYASDSPSYLDHNPSAMSSDDMEKAANAMSNAIYDGDLGDILPRFVHRDTTSWFQLWSRVAHATYAVKEDLTNRNLDPAKVIGDELDAANYNLDSAEAARFYEHNEKMKQFFQNVHPTLDVIWADKTVHGVTYEEVDVDQTYAQNEGSDWTRDDILDAIDEFNSGSADSEDKKHWDILQRVAKNKNSCSL